MKSFEKDGLTLTFWNEVIRPCILARDGFKCRKCPSTKQLCVHSKSEKHLNASDLITLCRSCHTKGHK